MTEFTALKLTRQAADLSLIEHLWDVVEQEKKNIMNVQQANLINWTQINIIDATKI